VPGYLVAHDRVRIGPAAAQDRRRFERRQNLGDDVFARPAEGLHVVLDHPLGVESFDDLRAQVLVREAQGVPRLVADDAAKLGVGRVHREALEVHRRPVFGDGQNVGARVRPGAACIERRFGARDANLRVGARLDEAHVGRLAPRVHVREDLGAQLGGRRVEKADRQVRALLAPIDASLDDEPALLALVPSAEVVWPVFGVVLEGDLVGLRQLLSWQEPGCTNADALVSRLDAHRVPPSR
jgi:hypothetical protein